jgi:hypothetical protein
MADPKATEIKDRNSAYGWQGPPSPRQDCHHKSEHLGQQLAVLGGLLEIAAAAQLQFLLQAPFEVAMGALDVTVLMSHAALLRLGVRP